MSGVLAAAAYELHIMLCITMLISGRHVTQSTVMFSGTGI